MHPLTDERAAECICFFICALQVIFTTKNTLVKLILIKVKHPSALLRDVNYCFQIYFRYNPSIPSRVISTNWVIKLRICRISRNKRSILAAE